MKLTVATAVRNAVAERRRSELVRCIESVAKLETPHEHLVYDGASTDGTVELLRELESKTPGLKVVSAPDTGIYYALNKGVRDAKGEWFYVLGCDDWIFAPLVLNDLLANHADGNRLLVSPVRVNGHVCQCPDESNLSTFFFRTPHCHQGIVVRTDELRALGGFDERYKICADLDIMLKLHDMGIPVFYSFEPFADYSPFGTSGKAILLGKSETAQCVRRFLRLSDGPVFDGRRSPPFHSMARFLFHKDAALRLSARFMVRKRIKQYFRILAYPLVLATRPVRIRRTRQTHVIDNCI